MSTNAFNPTGQSFLLVANSSAPTGVQPVVASGLGSGQFHIANTGAQVVYLGWGATAALAQAAAVIPTAGVPQTIIPIMPSSAAIYTLPVGSFVSGITASAGVNNVYITLGDGI